MTEQEMLKEALEWQEHIRKLITATDDELYHKRSKIFDWLIKQAERVEELELELELEKSINKDFEAYLLKQVESAKAQNERYKQALEFYADKKNYCEMIDPSGVLTVIEEDNGEKARQALEHDEN